MAGERHGRGMGTACYELIGLYSALVGSVSEEPVVSVLQGERWRQQGTSKHDTCLPTTVITSRNSVLLKSCNSILFFYIFLSMYFSLRLLSLVFFSFSSSFTLFSNLLGYEVMIIGPLYEQSMKGVRHFEEPNSMKHFDYLM